MRGPTRVCGIFAFLLSASCIAVSEAFSVGGARGPALGRVPGRATSACSVRRSGAASMSMVAAKTASRRAALVGFLALDAFLGLPSQSEAVYIDKADGMMKSGRRPQDETVNVKMGDDEFEVKFGKGPIGLDLQETLVPADAPRDKQQSRLVVSGIKPGSQAEKLAAKNPRLQPQATVVSVEGVNIEGMRGNAALRVLRDSKDTVEKEGYKLRVLFRDPK